jgi:hydrogenase maturation protease
MGDMILIIGIGNPLRQDDGAGWVLAERLHAMLEALGCPSRVRTVQQLAPEHAMDVAAPDVTAVCFTDVAVDAPGLRLIALDDIQPAGAARLTHEIGPGTLLAYASTLSNALPAAWLLTVGGNHFDHGEGLSEPVQAALADDAALRSGARRICNQPSSTAS